MVIFLSIDRLLYLSLNMTERDTSKGHIQQVDYIRAIASLAVALFHLGGKALPVLKYGWLGVHMFFLLSGFIICWSMPADYTWKMSGRFVGKRITRIEPPYIISIGLAIVMNFIVLSHYKPDWFNIACHLAYLNSFLGKPYLSPVYWTLGIEFQFYLFVALCFPWLHSKWGPWFLLVLCIVPTVVNVPGGLLFGVFPVFGLGILYYLYLKKIAGINTVLFLSVLIVVCCIYTVGWLPAGMALFTLLLLIAPLKSYAVVSFFSKISFSLYLTHDMVGSRLVVYMGTKLPKTVLFKGIEFLTGIVVSILFAYLFYLLVERPFFKLSKRISYNLISQDQFSE
ncbi:acyltransferase family protein [Mucilaginibacter inviolabilis]|uniref:acyltransferase family protein n=1 Tax=Mucilaginibacter inviolabilis TaxID=2714892 RepID=UPI00140E1133|nr:acyltransferase [Mucilaginibacter inviolabilis]